MSNLQDLKDSIMDPVSMTVMEDPYSITTCNHTFDKSTIDEWMANGNSTCLLCREPFNPRDVKPNFAMRETIKNVLPLIKQLEQDRLNGDDDGDGDFEMVEAFVADDGDGDGDDAKSDAEENKDADEAVVDVDGDVLVADAVENPSLKLTTHEEYLMVEVVNPDGEKEAPTDMVICIDVSSSMNSAVTRKDEDGNDVNDGLSILDIVKHSALSLIQRMKVADRVSIVTFATGVSEDMPMTAMDDSGMREAERTIKSLQARGETNFWAGIEKSLDILRAAYAGRNSVACILTDGCPTTRYAPTRGYMGALKKYRDKFPDFSCNLNMIGFGYSLDSKLLDELSQYMSSNYCFVPDGGMTGTVFIHLGANVAVTSGTNAQLKLEFSSGDELQRVLDDPATDIDTCYSWSRSERELSISLGNLCYGQNRSIVIPVSEIESAALTYTNMMSHRDENIFMDGPVPTVAEVGPESEAVKAQLFRQMLVSKTRKAMNFMACGDLTSAQGLIQETYRTMTAMGIHAGSECADIAQDLIGQISEAIAAQDAYTRWGRHYLPSLACAHMNQVCNNFKDPGVQRLGGGLFEKVRDYIDEQFNNLPDPVPSREPQKVFAGGAVGKAGGGGGFGGAGMMAAYNVASGGCFRGDCLVQVVGGQKRVDQIVKGDRVKAYKSSEFYEIETVVVLKCENRKSTFVKYGGLVITPYHPILIDDIWKFPMDVGEMFEQECDCVYNFVLRSGHVMTINDVPCVTLGHGFDDNDCIKHAYFGSQRVIGDLKKVTGYESGRVMLGENPMVRDPFSGLIVGMDVV